MNRAFTLLDTLSNRSHRPVHARILVGAATLTAFVSVLSAGSAQAAIATDCSAPGAISTGILTVTNIICGGDAAGRSDLKIEISQGGINYLFSGDLTPSGGFNDGNISYDIAILPTAGLEFQEVTLSATGLFSSYSATKEIAWAGGPGAVLVTGVPSVGPAEPVFSFAPFPSVKALSIKDIWLGATDSDTITDINNGFRLTTARAPGDSVPGPLPMAGAAVCFGLSRKLRARIRNAAIKA
ncbi:hypothetical protein [Cyanobium sp. N5-Cardenillas]|uniref:hypothetical protein n=1 Tax=Cyanobium sp. N5-Cardenillas TaxID=2823720 RepID=UPI0020CF5A3D|nr:hypothetical protein [Cyanobium sp. N5-Cardenillas]MCP9787266.1 hypothetical protein [Cyanobium sp. N5-Cardenillas]